MVIRNGLFAKYDNFELELAESRSEVPIPDEEKTFSLWYHNLKDCPFKDFKKCEFGNGFYKTVLIDQIEKPFLVLTYGKYKKLKIEVFKGKEHKIQIASRSELIAGELDMIKCREDWYTKDVEIRDIDLIWEEKFEIKKSKTIYGDILQLKDLWKEKIGQMKIEK